MKIIAFRDCKKGQGGGAEAGQGEEGGTAEAEEEVEARLCGGQMGQRWQGGRHKQGHIITNF